MENLFSLSKASAFFARFRRAAPQWVAGALVLLGVLSARGAAALQGFVGSHDPGTLVKEGNKYWMFTTGNGIYAAYSTDLIYWMYGPKTIFPINTWPSWINTYVPAFAGNFWAPECIFMNGKYYMYYSCSTFGSARSAIGLATSPTLDPTSPNYQWTDQGLVVSSTASTDVNAIDPAILKDANGQVYMYYGSFNGGLGVLELDATTGLKKTGAVVTRVAGNTTSSTRDWEAAYVVKENGYYYFYANRGACCQGKSSTYKIVVGRSTSPLGPFVDKNGVVLTATNAQATAAGATGVGSLVLGTSGRYIGPGHFGLLRDKGVNLVSMHYYDGTTTNGDPKLDIANLQYDASNWPVVTRNWLAAGRYKITNKNSGLNWDSWGCTAGLFEPVAQGTWTGLTCQKWDFVQVGDGFYKIANALNSNRVADLYYCLNANGTTIGIYDWLNNDCQKLKVERAADGSFTFSPAAASNRVIEVPGASTTAGVQLALFDYTGSTCQKWDIETVPASWTGAVSTAWSATGNWSTSVVPTTTANVYLPAGLTRYPALATGTGTANNLTIAPGASLTLSGGQLDLKGNFTNNGTLTATGGLVSFTGAAGQNCGGSQPSTFASVAVGTNGLSLDSPASVAGGLTLTGSLTTNAQAFTLLSSAAGTALVVDNGGGVTGRATMQRYVDPSLNNGRGYRHYASPMTDGTLADLTTTGYVPVFNPAYNTAAAPNLVTPFPTVFGYDQSRLTLTNTLGAFDKGWYSPAATDAMPNGRGFTVDIPATAKVAFNGTLATGPVTLSGLVRGPQNDAGWQLLGNPYPAPLDWSTLTNSNFTNLDQTVYVVQSTAQYKGGYRSYLRGVGGSPLVAAGQGFFVRVSTAGTAGSLSLTNANRATTLTAQPAFNRSPTTDLRPQVALALRGAGSEDVAYVYAESGAPTSFDGAFDAVKLFNSTGLNVCLPEPGGLFLAIRGLPGLTNNTVVPLTLTLPQAGSYQLAADQLLNLTGTTVYLHDAATNTTVNLQQQPTYAFTAASTAVANRFSLRFALTALAATPAQLTAGQLAIYPNPAASTVQVGVAQQPITACTLLTVLGQPVAVPQQAGPAGSRVLNVSGLAAGVYVLRVTTAAGTASQRLVVE